MQRVTKRTIKERFTGTPEFYQRTAKIAVPLALNQCLQSTMATIDTLMVSWIGMVSAVGTAAQIDTLCNMVSYGCIGGTGMFAAQFFGASDHKNLKHCMGLSFIMCLGNAVFWFLIATFLGRQVLAFYMNDPVIVADGLSYLKISRFSLIFSGITYCFSNMYRNTHQAGLALKVSVFASILNITLNALLIFGIGPFPCMGVRGAALGTVISSMSSALFLVIHAYATKQIFVGSPKELFGFNMDFVRPIFSRLWPLIVNESTFGFGQTLFIKAFGMLGKAAMDAYYVGNQIYNLFTFIIYGYGSAVQVLLGTRLGKGEIEEAKQECDYNMGLSAVLAGIMVMILLIFARPMVLAFRVTESSAITLAVQIVRVLAVKTSMRFFNFVIFCVLRSGGDSKILQFLDAGLEWAVGLTSAFICVYCFHMKSIVMVLLITQIEQLVRLVFGMKRVYSYRWARNLTSLV